MNTEIELSARQLHLVIAPRLVMTPMMSTLIARLAQRSAVQVLDGGNSFDAYRITRLVRQPAAPSGDPRSATATVENSANALGRIRVARAFTCYQMEALLASALPARSLTTNPLQAARTPATPIVVLDLLDTFYDESAPASERLRLLSRCLEQLRRASQNTTVLVSSRLHSGRLQLQIQAQPEFLQRLEETAQRVWRFEEPPARPAQIRLF